MVLVMPCRVVINDPDECILWIERFRNARLSDCQGVAGNCGIYSHTRRGIDIRSPRFEDKGQGPRVTQTHAAPRLSQNKERVVNICDVPAELEPHWVGAVRIRLHHSCGQHLPHYVCAW